ncbi:MAG TPA: hypothetical protein VER33_27535, partial [Polyangiaceae bacterium]|nr:hypothetical protein [Polyangiaceae bacterium]
MNLPFALKRRLLWINLPTAALLALLQRTPVLRFAQTAGTHLISSPLGAVLKSSMAAVGSLGAVHSLAGATQLSSSSASPFAATVGTAVTLGFSVTGTTSAPESWTVGGTFPPGLSFGGVTTGTIDAATLMLTGTPTTAGNYSITLRAHDALGFNSPVFSFVINVTGGATAVPAVTTQPQNQSVAA